MRPSKASNVVTYILGMGFNLALMAVVAYAIYWFAMWGFSTGGDFANEMLAVGPDEEVEFILDEDTPRAEVARRLEHYGIIPNQLLFRLEMFLKNSTRVYRAGVYTLNRNMTNTEVNATLRRPPTPEEAGHHVVRFLEGWTIAQMGAHLEHLGFFTAQEFIDYAEYGDFSHFRFVRDIPSHPQRRRLEGYLFPDTYHLPLNPTPRVVINMMLNQFEFVMNRIGPWAQIAEEMGFTLDDIINIASIIEGETPVPSERPIVSQVIHRRLRENILLQMDATVLYALDIPRTRVYLADLRVDSPFNTHIHHGLPLGPIGNPGRASIEAAFLPSDTNYLFFVVYYADHTRHVFTTNYADHNRFVQLYHASLPPR